MIRFIKHITVIFYLIYSFDGFSQVFYTTDTAYFQKISETYFLKDTTKNSRTFTDTSVFNFHNNLPFYFSGQSGMMQPNYLLNVKNNSLGFKPWDFYIPDFIDENSIDIFKTKNIFAKLEGIAGSKEEQHFRAFITSPIKKYSQVNFYFRRSVSKGFYQFQQSSVSNLMCSYHFFGKKKLSMDAMLILNGVKYQENGGIINDSLNAQEMILDKSLVNINLNSAKKNIRDEQLKWNIYYKIIENNHHKEYISTSVSVTRNIFKYSDDNPKNGYYPFVFLDTIKTRDSLNVLSLQGKVGYHIQFNKMYNELNYNYQYSKIYFHYDTSVINHVVQWKNSYTFQFKIPLQYSINAQYIVAGTQSGNYIADADILSKYNKFTFHFGAHSCIKSPTFNQNFWYANNYIWYNHFVNIFQNGLNFSINYKDKISVAYILNQYKNFIFYDSYAYPMQYQNYLDVHQINLNYHDILLRHIGIDLNYYYQQKNIDIILFPEHFVKSSLYYTGRIFQKNLLLQTGFQFVTSSLFAAYQYMPATGVYYIPNVNKAVGNYPQLNFFLSGRIKPVNFFIRVDNILAGIQPYYFIPHYMMPDMSIRMGISWMFFD